MLLVHEVKDRPGKWEVAWTWMPFFLASDGELIKRVDKSMTKALRGAARMKTTGEELHRLLHSKVLDLVAEAYPLQGLRQYLEGIEGVEP